MSDYEKLFGVHKLIAINFESLIAIKKENNMNVEIKVTQDHIELGTAKRCHFCPIALAFVDSYPGLNSTVEIAVFATFVNVYAKEAFRKIAEVQLPPVAVKFIRNFDRHGHNIEYTPFSFPVELPN